MANNEADHFVISGRVIAGIVFSSISGGAGLGIVVGPQADQAALRACYDNSQIAIDVAAQHGEEFNEIRADIAGLRNTIYERSADRYTATQARTDWIDHDRAAEARHEVLDKRLDALERAVDRLEER